MKAPILSGALDGLKPIEFSDRARYKAAVEAGGQIGFGYYFPFLLSRKRPGRSAVLYAEDEGSLCIFVWRRGDSAPRLDLLVAPTPMHPSVVKRCLERANDFNGDRSARILRIDAKDAALAAGVPGLRVKERKAQFLYAPRAFGDLAGRRFRTLRRNVQGFRQREQVEILPYDPRHAEACRDLLVRWARRHRRDHGTAGGVGTSRRTLDLADRLPAPDLSGELVFVEGRLVAFAFGGEIRPGVGCFFDAKSDNALPGLAYFHRYSFLSKFDAFEVVNDGSDVGRPGLRQLKESLRPVAMHLEYRGSQVAAV